MAFLKSLINRILPQSISSELEEPSDHYERLDYLRRYHEWIDVSPTQTGTRYQSLILAIDIDSKELIIDELYPPEQLDRIQPGDTLEVHGRSKRVAVSFYSRLLAKELRNGEPVYRLELPEDVGINQSRGAYRVYVENEVGLDIELYAIQADKSEEAISAVRIVNLSADGIKLSFPQDMSTVLGQQRIFNHCLIRLPTGFDIDCDIELRNLYAINIPHPHSLGGGKLTIAQPQQRTKLQQYLASVQRRQRRMDNRDL